MPSNLSNNFIALTLVTAMVLAVSVPIAMQNSYVIEDISTGSEIRIQEYRQEMKLTQTSPMDSFGISIGESFSYFNLSSSAPINIYLQNWVIPEFTIYRNVTTIEINQTDTRYYFHAVITYDGNGIAEVDTYHYSDYESIIYESVRYFDTTIFLQNISFLFPVLVGLIIGNLMHYPLRHDKERPQRREDF